MYLWGTSQLLIISQCHSIWHVLQIIVLLVRGYREQPFQKVPACTWTCRLQTALSCEPAIPRVCPSWPNRDRETCSSPKRFVLMTWPVDRTTYSQTTPTNTVKPRPLKRSIILLPFHVLVKFTFPITEFPCRRCTRARDSSSAVSVSSKVAVSPRMSSIGTGVSLPRIG